MEEGRYQEIRERLLDPTDPLGLTTLDYDHRSEFEMAIKRLYSEKDTDDKQKEFLLKILRPRILGMCEGMYQHTDPIIEHMRQRYGLAALRHLQVYLCPDYARIC